jgi:hypothetical protein
MKILRLKGNVSHAVSTLTHSLVNTCTQTQSTEKLDKISNNGTPGFGGGLYLRFHSLKKKMLRLQKKEGERKEEEIVAVSGRCYSLLRLIKGGRKKMEKY